MSPSSKTKRHFFVQRLKRLIAIYAICDNNQKRSIFMDGSSALNNPHFETRGCI